MINKYCRLFFSNFLVTLWNFKLLKITENVSRNDESFPVKFYDFYIYFQLLSLITAILFFCFLGYKLDIFSIFLMWVTFWFLFEFHKFPAFASQTKINVWNQLADYLTLSSETSRFHSACLFWNLKLYKSCCWSLGHTFWNVDATFPKL